MSDETVGLALQYADGKAAAGFALHPGGVLLGLGDADGKERARLQVTSAGPEFSLNDSEQNQRVHLLVASGGPTINLLNADGGFDAGLGDAGMGPLLVLGGKGGNHAQIGVVSGVPQISLMDADFRAGLAMEGSGKKAGIRLYDENNAVRAGLVFGAGLAGLSLNGENGESLVSAQTGPNGPSLIVSDSQGRVLFTKP